MLRLSALAFVNSMKAYEFNIMNTAPQFFFTVYKKGSAQESDNLPERPAF